MEPILIIGIIIISGLVVGEICTRIGLPKVTGYILAGLILNPNLTPIVPESFIQHTSLVTNIALSFITFSVGGTLLFSKIRSLGKPIVYITLFEAEFAFLFVAVFFTLLAPVLNPMPEQTLVTFYLPMALLLASLASPTDPSVTISIMHEYKAKGEVSSTVMGVAAFDDILGIINYSLAVSVAAICILNEPVSSHSFTQPLFKIGGSMIIGAIFGFFLNFLTKLIKKESEGVLITLIIGLLALCYGLAGMIGIDELLSTMTMGIIVVNYNHKSEKIFKILERYTEELIFVLFFTISAMHLDLGVLTSNWLFILLFVVFRASGKFAGTLLGGKLSNASPAIQKFTVGGLVPQGGIVIGLALVIKQNTELSAMSDVILNVVIGATIIHEVIGPLVSKFALQRAGEITVRKE